MINGLFSLSDSFRCYQSLTYRVQIVNSRDTSTRRGGYHMYATYLLNKEVSFPFHLNFLIFLTKCKCFFISKDIYLALNEDYIFRSYLSEKMNGLCQHQASSYRSCINSRPYNDILRKNNFSRLVEVNTKIIHIKDFKFRIFGMMNGGAGR